MALHGGRQRGDQVAVGGSGGGGASSSSIALLQERFRQLEKMREKREEMELLKLFSESETVTRKKHHERSGNALAHPETTARSSFQESLSLGLDLYGKKTEHQSSKTPPYRDFWSMDSVRVSTSRTHEKPDVDTSLHL